jgi:hypothetical protein
MPKDDRTYLPEQELLLPPSLREWLPENHLVYFVSDVVDQLDLSAIHAVYEKEKRGQPPYDPRLMTKLLLYGYCTGTPSGRDAGSARAVLQSTICCWWRRPGYPRTAIRTICAYKSLHVKPPPKLRFLVF